MRQKPGVEPGGFCDFGVGQAISHRLGDQREALGGGDVESGLPVGGVGGHGRFPPARQQSTKPRQPNIQPAHCLVQRFGEGAANGHHLAHAFHLRPQGGIRAGEFLKIPARNLDDHIINARLETGWGDAGDVVGDFIQRISHRQQRGNFGDGKAGGLAGQRRRAGNARVHFDDDHVAGGRIDGKLHIAAAGFYAHGRHHTFGQIAQVLVFLVRQGHRRGYRDAVAGMHAHRVDVLDGTNHDKVVGAVTHDFQFVLFPAQQRAFDQHLAHRAGAQTMFHDGRKFIRRVGHPATCPAHGKRSANQNGIADLGNGRLGFFY